MIKTIIDADSKAVVDAVNVNKNITITLPTPSNDQFIFRGWYKEATF